MGENDGYRLSMFASQHRNDGGCRSSREKVESRRWLGRRRSFCWLGEVIHRRRRQRQLNRAADMMIDRRPNATKLRDDIRLLFVIEGAQFTQSGAYGGCLRDRQLTQHQRSRFGV